MPVITPPIGLQAGSHSAQAFRQLLAALSGAPVQTFPGGVQATTGGGAHGVVANGLAVTQNGTPNMSVNVAAGSALVNGTSVLAQGVYAVTNDAQVNLAIATADATNPRRDLACIQVRDNTADGGGFNDARLFVITGTPAASPVDPAVPAGCLVLARVQVNAAATSITNANITDLRIRATALGGIVVCTSTTRPSGASLVPGLFIFETNTNTLLVWNGSAWVTVWLQNFTRQSWHFQGLVSTNASGDFTMTHNRGKNPIGMQVSASQAGLGALWWLDNVDTNTTRFRSANLSTFITVCVSLFFDP